MRQFLIAVGVLILAGAGQALPRRAHPDHIGVARRPCGVVLGAVMAFCGDVFPMRKV